MGGVFFFFGPAVEEEAGGDVRRVVLGLGNQRQHSVRFVQSPTDHDWDMLG